MSDEHHEVEHPPPFGEVPAEFLDPEGDGELNDPSLTLESSASMRAAWKDWFCGKGPGKFVDVQFFGRGIGGVPAPAADAYKALEAALKASGYPHGRSWSNVCRKIANSSNYSLHSYGIAIDIDAPQNPQSSGSPWSGRIQKQHVDAVLSVKNTAGRTIWEWGGHWSTPDRMHFQLDLGPSAVAVDWNTVPGAAPVDLPGVTHRVTASSLNLRAKPSTAGDKVASLPNGTEVAAQSGAREESDGYEWIKVKAGYGGRIVEGWVATKYLESVAGAPETQKATRATAEKAAAPADTASKVESVTHRVTASGLNVRERPTLEGELITELPRGTEVALVPDEARQADGYDWVMIRAVVGDEIARGWVAAKYLEEVG